MQRRTFSHRLLAVGVVSAVPWLLANNAQAQGSLNLKEGQDFVRLTQKVAVDVPAGQIEVLEFFSYGCIHCFHFDPLLQTWLKQKPAYVTFKRVPVFSEPLQRVFYALEAMGQLDSKHEKLFSLFFTDSVRPAANKPEAMADWVAKAGALDRNKFLELYSSFSVAGKVKRASQLVDAYQVEGTPAIGIAGRFMVPGQAERTLPIVNALIEQARKG